MRWSIIRLIWFRELRDQLRDRRTIFMIVVLPILLYPILGIGILSIAVGFLKQKTKIGVYNASSLPPPGPNTLDTDPAIVGAWFAPCPVGPSGPDWLTATAGLTRTSRERLEYPPLFQRTDELRFSPLCFEKPDEAEAIDVVDLGELPLPRDMRDDEIGTVLAEKFASSPEKDVDLILVVPPDFHTRLEREGKPEIYVVYGADDRSRLVAGKVHLALTKWKRGVKDTRLLRKGQLPAFDEPIQIVDPERDKPATKRAAQSIFDLMGKIFPFLIVMWSLAGALYPAVDLCAGEKERGTMETLLISPASREEIVMGKFLAIWVFSAATALLNLLSMGITTWNFLSSMPEGVLRPTALLWSLLLLLPLSAFFSALCLAIGAYARSSKEGQYYLMPLFLITMPLIFMTLAPGVQLDPFYSLVPVTGVALLLQKLIAGNVDAVTWLYFIPVLGPMVIYGWLAMRWAVHQFQREEVLFREAERLDLVLWVKSLFREKAPLPGAGQALFCFGVILVLRWFSFGWSSKLPLVAALGVGYLAFVLVPPSMFALFLTKHPLESLSLRKCSWKILGFAVVLAVILVLPLGELTALFIQQYPQLKTLLRSGSPLARELEVLHNTDRPLIEFLKVMLPYVLVMGIIVPICEEVAFRGFLLNGLFKRFKPWTAVLLSSFLFAVYHANVFQFLPAFFLGGILAVFAARSRSLIPGIVFHGVHNTLLILLAFAGHTVGKELEVPMGYRLALSGVLLVAAVCLLGRLWIRGYRFLEVGEGERVSGS